MPLIGRAISKHTTAYSWLPESTRLSRAAGLPPNAGPGIRGSRYELLMGGYVRCTWGRGRRRQQ